MIFIRSILNEESLILRWMSAENYPSEGFCFEFYYNRFYYGNAYFTRKSAQKQIQLFYIFIK